MRKHAECRKRPAGRGLGVMHCAEADIAREQSLTDFVRQNARELVASQQGIMQTASGRALRGRMRGASNKRKLG